MTTLKRLRWEPGIEHEFKVYMTLGTIISCGEKGNKMLTKSLNIVKRKEMLLINISINIYILNKLLLGKIVSLLKSLFVTFLDAMREQYH